MGEFFKVLGKFLFSVLLQRYEYIVAEFCMSY